MTEESRHIFGLTVSLFQTIVHKEHRLYNYLSKLTCKISLLQKDNIVL